jgi:branched-subunit amino acid transport protein
VTSVWPVILAAAAGVLLPKVLPALLLPERMPKAVGSWLEYVPAGMLGAFTAITVTAYARSAGPPWWPLAALAAAGAVALLTRRTFAALLTGWLLLAALHLLRLA